MKVLSIDVGIKNLAYCIIEKNENDFNILSWDIIKLGDNIKCKKLTLYDISKELFEILDKIHIFMTVDEVLIENQPSFKNPTMKSIAVLLYSFFHIRGIVDKQKTNSNINSIKFISPSNKLKIGTAVKKDLSNNESKKYRLTKETSIKYCLSIISEEEKNILNKYKKKDDLCDAFLQGFQYMFKPVPEKYIIKLKEMA